MRICDSVCQVCGTGMPFTDTPTLHLLCLPQTLPRETFLMACLSSDHLQPFYLCSDPPPSTTARDHILFHIQSVSRSRGFCLPNTLSPFLQLHRYHPNSGATNSLQRYSNSLLTGVLLLAYAFSSLSLTARRRLLNTRSTLSLTPSLNSFNGSPLSRGQSPNSLNWPTKLSFGPYLPLPPHVSGFYE